MSSYNELWVQLAKSQYFAEVKTSWSEREWIAENYYLELKELLDLQADMYQRIGLETDEK